MLTLRVRVYSDYYTLSTEIRYPPVETMAEIHQQAHAHRNDFMADKFVVIDQCTRRYRKDA